MIYDGSSLPEMFCKKEFLRIFAKFTGKKHLYQSLFLNEVAGLRPATLLKKKLGHRCFPVNFGKFLITPFLIEIFGKSSRRLKVSNTALLITIQRKHLHANQVGKSYCLMRNFIFF